MEPQPFTMEEQLAASVAIANARKLNGHAAEVPETPAPKRRKPAAPPVFVPEPLPKEMAEALKAPLPPQAIEAHSQIPGLSSIKPMYVIERLNDVFGVGQWKERYETVATKDIVKVITKWVNGEEKKIEKPAVMVVVKGFLTISRYNIDVEQFGGNDNDDLGNAYKGACTDALTKCCSHLGIGQEVYKGLVNGQAVSQPRASRQPKPPYTPPQTAVMDRKLNELKQQTQPPSTTAAAAPAPEPEKQLPSKSMDIFAAFAEIREKIGEVAYLSVLNQHKVMKPSEFKSYEAAKAAYKDLLRIERKGVA